MSCFLRKLPLSRLLLLCALVVVLGASLTALAFALGSGPTPPPKPLADAIHDALSARAGGDSLQGVSAQVELTDHLLEGANLASGSGGGAGQLSSSPLLTGASGRLWIAKSGDFRLELQSEQGDTQIYGSPQGPISMYDAASNTLYRLELPAHTGSAQGAGAEDRSGASNGGESGHEPPSVTEIEAAISKLERHLEVSGAQPTDVAGQAAYTVSVEPREKGSLIGEAELSWDAVHGVPLRAALYSTESSTPVLELTATSIAYGPVESSTLEFEPPAGARVEEVTIPEHGAAGGNSEQHGERPQLTTFGKGPATIAVLEGRTESGTASQSGPLPEGVQQVQIDGATASELTTQLGTLLSFERQGVSYLVAGAVEPSAVEAVAKGL